MPDKLLLFSNSTNAGEPWMEYTLPHIREFLEDISTGVLFIPYAGVTISYDEYYAGVQSNLEKIGIEVQSIHHADDPVQAIRDARAIMIGGGNSFQLLHQLQANRLIEPIRQRQGAPYIGWSAGTNMACPTLKTTNDMPIIEPQQFEAINLIPFQINPHYMDANPEGHAGETREQRILEFLAVNPAVKVCGLREGTWFKLENGQLTYHGNRTMRLFQQGLDPKEYEPGEDLSFLMG